MYDDGIIALLKWKDGNWIVAEYDVDPTDTFTQPWIEKYDLDYMSNLGISM